MADVEHPEQGLRHRRHADDNEDEEEANEPPVHEVEQPPQEQEGEENQEENQSSYWKRICCCCCCCRRTRVSSSSSSGSKCCSTWMKYSLASVIIAGLMIHHAFETKKQFYPAVIYLVTSKPSISILGNLAFVLLISSAKLFQSMMLGSLYPLEVERASEALRFSILDTCLALTLFREDLSYRVVTLFAFLLLSKSFHSLADARMDSHEQHDSRMAMMQDEPQTQDSRHTKCGHFCFVALLVTLFGVDLALSLLFSYRVAEEGPSVAILFAFEYIVMLLSIALVAYRYVLYHVAHRIEAQTEGAWVNKNLYLMYGRLFISMIKLLVLMTYFTILTAFITFPIMIVRDLFVAFRAVRTELQNLVATRRLRRQITERFMRPTQEEIDDSGGLDIISHLELQPETSIKLPCNHIFREDALLSWWERQQTCPVCRYDVNQAEPAAYVEERERRRRLQNNAPQQDEATAEDGNTQENVDSAEERPGTGDTDDADAQRGRDAPRESPTGRGEDVGTAVAAADTSRRENVPTYDEQRPAHGHVADTRTVEPERTRGIQSSQKDKEGSSRKEKSKKHRSKKKKSKRSKKRHSSKHRRRSSSTESSSSDSPDYMNYPQMPMPFMPPPPEFYGMNYWQSMHSPYWNSPHAAYSGASPASGSAEPSTPHYPPQQYPTQYGGGYPSPFMFPPPAMGAPSGDFPRDQVHGLESNTRSGGIPPFWPPPHPWMQPPSMPGATGESAFQPSYLNPNNQTQPSSRVRISPEADGRADLQQPVTDIPTEFTEACQRGNIEKVRDFLDRGVVNANTDEGFPLTNACEAGHLNIVKLLCERGADPNVKDGLPLCEARLEGHTEIVNYLQERMEATRTTNTTDVSTNETNASAAASDSAAAGSPAESQDEIRRRRLAALTGNATSQS